MAMPPHLQAAKDRSMAKEAAKEAPTKVDPMVAMLGLRRTLTGYEVVRAVVPASQVTALAPSEPLQFASQTLLLAVRSMLDQVA